MNSFIFFIISLSEGDSLWASWMVVIALALSPRWNSAQAPRNNSFACTSGGGENDWQREWVVENKGKKKILSWEVKSNGRIILNDYGV